MKKLGLLAALFAMILTSANAGYYRTIPNGFGGFDTTYHKDASDFYNWK